jgi:hypothetical protein
VKCAGRPDCRIGEVCYDRMVERGCTAGRCAGVVAAACTQGKRTQHGKPLGVVGDDQPDSGDGQAGRLGVAERLVVPLKPGNAGGGKGPWFKADAGSDEGDEIGVTLRNSGIFSRCEMHTMWKRRKNSNLLRGTPLAGNGRREWLRKCHDGWSRARTRLSHHRHWHTRPSVGESMMSCPRAGCGRSASPVR